MGQRIKSISLLFIIVSLTTMGLASNQALAGLPPVPDANMANPFLGDFKCYNVNIQEHFVDDVILEDQFLREQYDVGDILKICTMVFKAAGPDFPESAFPQFFDPSIYDGNDEQHFVVYELCDESTDGPDCVPASTVDFPVSIVDQFGTTDHETLHQPIELWVPANKEHIECPSGYTYNMLGNQCEGPQDPCPPPDAGSVTYNQSPDGCVGGPIGDTFSQEQNIHFKCYDIEPRGIAPKLLNLFDENFFPFGMLNEIDTADKLCNPVLKNSEDFQSLDIEHLKCYDINNPFRLIEDLLTQDQFGSQQLQTVDEEEFCSASDKFPLQEMIGGTLIPIDATSLILVGAQNTVSWMIPIIISGIGISLVFLRRK